MCEVLNKAFNGKRPFNLSENDLFVLKHVYLNLKLSGEFDLNTVVLSERGNKVRLRSKS